MFSSKRISIIFVLWILSLIPPYIYGDVKVKLPWNSLSKYNYTMTREEFLNLAGHIYSPDKSIYQYLRVTRHYVDIYPDRHKKGPKSFRLYFAKDFQSKRSLHIHVNDFLDSKSSKNTTTNCPLKGLRIMLDPGHIGGKYAVMEQRIFRVGDLPPIREAELTLKTALLMKKRLEKLGASVYMTKADYKPVTKERPENFSQQAKRNIRSKKDKDSNTSSPEKFKRLLQKEMEQLFYRGAEIRARAELVRRIKPDLTLCIHFNAAPEKPGNPWVKGNRLVLFIHGSYEPEELTDEDMRYRFFTKLLEGSHDIELSLTNKIASVMMRQTGLPPVIYPPSPHYIKVGKNPCVYARNLAANRYFPGPVVYLEPYYQNNRLVYERAVAGDYKGEKIIQGKPYKSIYREYANSVVEGILKFFH